MMLECDADPPLTNNVDGLCQLFHAVKRLKEVNIQFAQFVASLDAQPLAHQPPKLSQQNAASSTSTMPRT